MAEGNTYQPGWDDAKKKKHHHHHHIGPNERNRGLGGALRMKDKQAYYGLMTAIIAGVCVGLFFLIRLIVREIQAMPNDDPTTEMTVDELRIHKVEEQDALLYSDSLAQAFNVDSLRRNVQIDTRPVYRPPRKKDEWYITRREWKEIWHNLQIWKKSKDEE